MYLAALQPWTRTPIVRVSVYMADDILAGADLSTAITVEWAPNGS